MCTSLGRLAVPLAAWVALAACGSQGAAPDGATTPAANAEVTGEVVVFAAASLTAAFTDLGDAFADAHPGTTVTFNFAGSSSLATQIVEGAPADVFASADTENMARVADAGSSAGVPTVFATNEAEIVVAPGNPAGIGGVVDLADDDLIVVLCAPEVPCGRYAQQVFENAGVTVAPKSWEDNVNAVVAKVALGEADAGVVYATDIAAADDRVDGVAIPPDVNVTAPYPITTTADARNAVGARAFIDFVLGSTGRSILASHGFDAP